jgi:hypothetical protein
MIAALMVSFWFSFLVVHLIWLDRSIIRTRFQFLFGALFLYRIMRMAIGYFVYIRYSTCRNLHTYSSFCIFHSYVSCFPVSIAKWTDVREGWQWNRVYISRHPSIFVVTSHSKVLLSGMDVTTVVEGWVPR